MTTDRRAQRVLLVHGGERDEVALAHREYELIGLRLVRAHECGVLRLESRDLRSRRGAVRCVARADRVNERCELAYLRLRGDLGEVQRVDGLAHARVRLLGAVFRAHRALRRRARRGLRLVRRAEPLARRGRDRKLERGVCLRRGARVIRDGAGQERVVLALEPRCERIDRCAVRLLLRAHRFRGAQRLVERERIRGVRLLLRPFRRRDGVAQRTALAAQRVDLMGLVRERAALRVEGKAQRLRLRLPCFVHARADHCRRGGTRRGGGVRRLLLRELGAPHHCGCGARPCDGAPHLERHRARGALAAQAANEYRLLSAARCSGGNLGAQRLRLFRAHRRRRLRELHRRVVPFVPARLGLEQRVVALSARDGELHFERPALLARLVALLRGSCVKRGDLAAQCVHRLRSGVPLELERGGLRALRLERGVRHVAVCARAFVRRAERRARELARRRLCTCSYSAVSSARV